MKFHFCIFMVFFEWSPKFKLGLILFQYENSRTRSRTTRGRPHSSCWTQEVYGYTGIFICLFIYSFICLFIYLFICLINFIVYQTSVNQHMHIAASLLASFVEPHPVSCVAEETLLNVISVHPDVKNLFQSSLLRQLHRCHLVSLMMIFWDSSRRIIVRHRSRPRMLQRRRHLHAHPSLRQLPPILLQRP